MSEEKKETENKDKARLWLLGQKLAKEKFIPEAFTHYWSGKLENEREEEKERNEHKKS